MEANWKAKSQIQVQSTKIWRSSKDFILLFWFLVTQVFQLCKLEILSLIEMLPVILTLTFMICL